MTDQGERHFTKGHGTENDFVLVADLDGTHDVTAEQVRRLTDRRAGIGGDGVIRVVPTLAAAEQHVRDQGVPGPLVHGLSQRRRQCRRDVWQRRPGVRGIPAP